MDCDREQQLLDEIAYLRSCSISHRELEFLLSENTRLRGELDDSRQQLRDRDRTIVAAKNSDPVLRPNLRRCQQLAETAFMWVSRVHVGGPSNRKEWLLTFGRPIGFDLRYVSMARRFKSLREIWDILIEGFSLNELFKGFLKTGKRAPVLPFKKVVFHVDFSELDSGDNFDFAVPDFDSFAPFCDST